MNTQALTKSAIVSTVLQVIMVLVNHYQPGLAGPNLAPIGGTAIGAIGGFIYSMLAMGGSQGQAAGGGAAAGAIGGVLGSVLSMGMGDVPASTVAVAGGSTLVSGAIGGILGKMFGGRAS
ncbi:MAG TPA: hypothetical protein VL295_09825 [Gemmatimonadales bacterium]|nr:hypothetical protein [Gemmatimonadales bacterium]